MFVDGEVVEDDDIAGLEHRDQHLLDVRQERRIIEGAGEDGGRPEALDAERRDDGVRLPVATRGEVPQADTFRATPIPTNQVGGDAGFIDKVEAAGVPVRLPRVPLAPCCGDVRPALLVGVFVAMLVLLPESLAAIKAARRYQFVSGRPERSAA